MKRPLKELLSLDPDTFEESDLDTLTSDEKDNNNISNTSIDNNTNLNSSSSTSATPTTANQQPGLCIECGNQPAEIGCLKCSDNFCTVCFGYLHRTGKRRSHETRDLVVRGGEDNKADDLSGLSNEDGNEGVGGEGDGEGEGDENIKIASQSIRAMRGDDTPPINATGAARLNPSMLFNSTASSKTSVSNSRPELAQVLTKIKQHCQYIPMRLTMEERKLLRLLEAALNVSDYTDKVDVVLYKTKSKRILAQLKEMCSILAGLVVATDMDLGKTMFFKSKKQQNDGNDDEEDEEDDDDENFSTNAEWYKTVFEIGRRYKIMNPEKMRDSFGKLMYMIMDSQIPEIKSALEFDFYKPISTVYSFLESRGPQALQLLDDPLLLQAVVEILPEGKPRVTIQNEIRRKENAIKVLSKKYSVPSQLYGSIGRTKSRSTGVSVEEIQQCLYSIGDYHAYLRANRHPVESIIKLLLKYFEPEPSTTSPDNTEIDSSEYSLGISSGQSGARLSHSHTKQFHYVHQSLTLWSEIMRDMFMLWFQADTDLLSAATPRYELTDTGQGLNRIKSCPSVSRSMHNIIKKAMDRTGQWIGSSVVHLGDHAVPNALFFLDKYTQVPRILAPVFIVIQDLETRILKNDPFILDYVEEQFGGVEELKKSK